MNTISFIICNSGDGSNHLQWFNRRLTRAECDELEVASKYEEYSSGDGVQYRELSFPDEFSIQGWAALNNIELLDFDEVLADLACGESFDLD